MAEACSEKGPDVDSSLNTLSQLRSTAEHHLREIEQERQREEVNESRRLQELDHYKKHRRRGKEGLPLPSATTPTPKMRSAQDVLNRLQWDNGHDIARYTIGYLERFAGIVEVPASSWIPEPTEEEWIPQHRIKYYKRALDNGDQEVVWDREKRIDKIFGSGRGSQDESPP